MSSLKARVDRLERRKGNPALEKAWLMEIRKRSKSDVIDGSDRDQSATGAQRSAVSTGGV